MKTLTEITNAVEDVGWYATYDLLKEWGDSIVNQCIHAATGYVDENHSIVAELEEVKTKIV